MAFGIFIWPSFQAYSNGVGALGAMVCWYRICRTKTWMWSNDPTCHSVRPPWSTKNTRIEKNYIQIYTPPSDNHKHKSKRKVYVPMSSPLPHWSWPKLVVVDSCVVVMLSIHRISTLEQQTSQMKRYVDRKDPTYVHINKRNKDRIQADSPKTNTHQTPWDPPKTHLHMPSDDDRCPAWMEARRENIIPSLGTYPQLAFLNRTQTLTKLKKTSKYVGALPPASSGSTTPP